MESTSNQTTGGTAQHTPQSVDSEHKNKNVIDFEFNDDNNPLEQNIIIERIPEDELFDEVITSSPEHNNNSASEDEINEDLIRATVL